MDEKFIEDIDKYQYSYNYIPIPFLYTQVQCDLCPKLIETMYSDNRTCNCACKYEGIFDLEKIYYSTR